MRPALFGVLLAIGIAIVPGAAGAQEGTPATDTAGGTACTDIEPRDASFFAGLSGTPAAESDQDGSGQAADATPEPFAMPEGEAADESVVAEVTAHYEQLIACLNAGDYLRAYTFYSDEYLVENLSEETLGNLEATPVPVEASTQSSFGAVLDARMLDDDHVAVLVTTSNPRTGDILLYAVLSRDGDQWRIDEEQVVEAEIPEATPAA
jgi:hypothetical protein